MDKEKYRRFGWAIYLFILTLSIVVGTVGAFVLTDGALHDISLNLSAGLLEVALVFFLVERLFLYNPEDERRKELGDQLQNLVAVLKGLTDTLKYAEVQSTPEKAFQELINEYQNSEKSIEVISWKDIQAQLTQEHAKEYFSATEKRLKSSPPIAFRWLLWTEEHLDFASRVVEEQDVFSVAEMGFFIPPLDGESTVIPCAIIDDRIANFGWGYLGRTRIDQLNVTLKQPEAAHAFTEYFAYLWQNSVIVKKRGEHKLDEIKVEQVRKTLKSRRDTSVQTSQRDAYQQVIDSYESSKESINNISWKNLRVREDDLLRKRYFERMLEKIKNDPLIRFRRLLWSPEHLEFLEDVAELYDGLPNVEFRYFDLTKNREVPIVPCTIVDDTVVDFGWEALGSPQMDIVNITLRQSKAVTAFKSYFTYVWHESIVLKEKDGKIRRDILAELKGSATSLG